MLYYSTDDYSTSDHNSLHGDHGDQGHDVNVLKPGNDSDVSTNTSAQRYSNTAEVYTIAPIK